MLLCEQCYSMLRCLKYTHFVGCSDRTVNSASAGPQLSIGSAHANSVYIANSWQQRVLRAIHIQHLCAARP
jgi:hypothetical protein